MAELTRNSDLVEMGVDEFAAPVKEVEKKPVGRPKAVKK